MTQIQADHVPAAAMLASFAHCLQWPDDALHRFSVTGTDSLPSIFPVSDFATATIGAAALSLSRLMANGGHAPQVNVDRRLASLWFNLTIQPIGWQLPSLWEPIAGDYQGSNGWIRLHTNAPHHRMAALAVLQCPATREDVARAVASWDIHALEAAIVDNGGCAAVMRSLSDWAKHPQGIAIQNQPLIAFHSYTGATTQWRPSPLRPLEGLKVLDLTRVLAGPIATRWMAGYGADVLRVDPPHWDEGAVIPEVTPGKRCIRLDLTKSADRQTFETLLASADVLVHGYRADALEHLGYGEARRRQIRPALIDVSLNAYGWSGPWQHRRGFDSLVQMSTGIADAGMLAAHASQPKPLPVQALDHGTGYLMAAAVVRGMHALIHENRAYSARLSLARTAAFLIQCPRQTDALPMAALNPDDIAAPVERTFWGNAQRLHSPAIIDGAPMAWDRPAGPLGTGAPHWL
ncbi:MAG: CoA transferase [Hyphomicrobiales bacterium]|nr:CoA transferase [Hyphomicrobiales bacterium]MDE2114851.1 CoA transferase [Hyphomicrobiales bacterium]